MTTKSDSPGHDGAPTTYWGAVLEDVVVCTGTAAVVALMGALSYLISRGAPSRYFNITPGHLAEVLLLLGAAVGVVTGMAKPVMRRSALFAGTLGFVVGAAAFNVLAAATMSRPLTLGLGIVLAIVGGGIGVRFALERTEA